MNGGVRSWLLKLAAGTARRLPAPVTQQLYRLGPLTRALRMALNRAAPTGMTDVRVAAGGLEGVLMTLDLQTEKDFWLGTYEQDLQAAVKDLVRPGMTAYDLGANIGYITLLLAGSVGERGHVVAFEPLPANLSRLAEHVARNALGDRVTIIPAAAADRRGTRRFLVRTSGGMGKLEGAAGRVFLGEAAIPVRTIDLDSFVYRAKGPLPDVVKIDVEGGEVMALPGMRRLLREARPAILLEVHGPEAARVVWAEMDAARYALFQLKRPYPRIHRLEDMDWKAYVLALPGGENA
jgi:FkbM family methyltransferase